MKITKREDAPTLETVKGRRGERLMTGEKCMMMINTIEPGIPPPPHSPPPAPMGVRRGGRGRRYIGGETQEMEAQATFLVPPHAAHNFDATGDKPAVLIEAFAPPREDYLARVEKEG